MGVIENLKEAAAIIQQLGNLDLYRKLLDSEREVQRLEENIKELERTLAIKKVMHFRQPYYYQEGDNTPYCPGCWESKNLAVHVAPSFLDSGVRMICPHCKVVYFQ